ncbi:FAD-dependent oxidoreductase [Arthrobacter sp. Marseille-P9274]|uniref:FAD-dependent oxidoreductase n=1 Tax=Arthrobacter sp. Marseille-P9274 TaxID=2866572 RepID=UPI0027BB1906|nr:FAD-dependent oxidoreductase [Arthrobacter sp. Marseille-P9274]
MAAALRPRHSGFPGLEPDRVAAKMCMVTDSPDGQFLLGRLHPGSRIIVASGDTGHGFKHAPAIGELAAQIALGETPFIDLDFLDPARFAADRPLVRPIGR